jgi:Uma2 family endonuclease
MHRVPGQRRVWTCEAASRVTEFFPDERLELIEGDLIDKTGQKPPHVYAIMVLNRLLSEAFPGRVRVQSSISVPDPYSEPEPDLVVVSGRAEDFAERHPSPADISLVIEVADTSLTLDRTVKSRVYARAGIAEYWIVDIPGRRTIVCRRPDGDEYRAVEIYAEAEEVSFSNLRCSAGMLLPPRI